MKRKLIFSFILILLCITGCDCRDKEEAHKDFMTSIFHDDYKMVKNAIAAGVDINHYDEEGFTPLYNAIAWGKSDVAELLIENGADVNLKTKHGYTPLYIASLSTNVEMTRLLLDHGAQINVKDPKGFTPLEQVYYTYCFLGENYQEIIFLLLSRGADSGEPYRYELFKACREGDAEKLEEILKKGGNLKARDPLKNTLLHYAINIETTELLVNKGLSPNILNNNQETPLHNPVNAKRAKYLIDKDLDVNARNTSGFTPLHGVATSPESDDSLIETAKVLLKNGADINAEGKKGITPLTWAVIFNKSGLVKFLLDSGARIKPEMLGIALNQGHIETARILIDAGADVNTRYDNKSTVLHGVVWSGKVESAKLLIERGAVIDKRDENGETPFLLAAKLGYKEIVKLLLVKGVDVNSVNEDRETALHISLQERTSYDNEQDHEGTARLLIEHGADINIKDARGNTPLYYALASGFEDIAEILRKNGAKTDKIPEPPEKPAKRRRRY